MKKTKLSVAIALLATTPLTFAADGDNSFWGITPSASVALTTNYMWRGVSQSNNDPAIQGSIDFAHDSGVYIGAWGSSVEFGDQDNSMELDGYAGFSRDTDLGGLLPSSFNYDLGILRYEYTGLPKANFTELYFGASVSPFENFNFSTYWYYGLKIDHVPGEEEDPGSPPNYRWPGEYTDISADYTLPDSMAGFTLLAHVGHYNQKGGGEDYWDWKVGIAKDVAGFNFEVAYYNTDGADAGTAPYSRNSLDDSKVVATISRELGGNKSSAMLPDEFEASAGVALTTDYMWRGVSQTNNEPAIQGSFDLSHEYGFYIGAWASSYEFKNEASMELDVYAGFSRDVNLGGVALNYDLGWLRYEYTSESAANFNEIYFGATVSPIENLNISTYWYYGVKIEHTKPGEYTDMAIDYTLPESLGSIILLGHAGYYNQKDMDDDGKPLDDYWDWKAGVARDFGPFNIEVAYFDTDDTGSAGKTTNGRSLDDGRVVGTISASF